MEGEKRQKSKRVGAVRKEKNILQKCYKYYKNISEIFQIILTFLSKCNIYNTSKTQK